MSTRGDSPLTFQEATVLAAVIFAGDNPAEVRYLRLTSQEVAVSVVCGSTPVWPEGVEMMPLYTFGTGKTVFGFSAPGPQVGVIQVADGECRTTDEILQAVRKALQPRGLYLPADYQLAYFRKQRAS